MWSFSILEVAGGLSFLIISLASSLAYFLNDRSGRSFMFSQYLRNAGCFTY